MWQTVYRLVLKGRPCSTSLGGPRRRQSVSDDEAPCLGSHYSVQAVCRECFIKRVWPSQPSAASRMTRNGVQRGRTAAVYGVIAFVVGLSAVEACLQVKKNTDPACAHSYRTATVLVGWREGFRAAACRLSCGWNEAKIYAADLEHTVSVLSRQDSTRLVCNVCNENQVRIHAALSEAGLARV